MIIMRPAQPRDADNLFAWRNDPLTQANSRSTAPVSREDHDRWMKFHALGGFPEHMVMIAEEPNLGSVGTVRFDSIKGDLLSFEVGITVAPIHRGRGLAEPMLLCACSYMPDFSIHAEVRRENTASRRLFQSCGFDEVGRSSSYLNFVREPNT